MFLCLRSIFFRILSCCESISLTSSLSLLLQVSTNLQKSVDLVTESFITPLALLPSVTPPLCGYLLIRHYHMTSFVMLTCDLIQRMRVSLWWMATQRMHWGNGGRDGGRRSKRILLFYVFHRPWIENRRRINLTIRPRNQNVLWLYF